MSTSKPWNRMQSNAGSLELEVKFVMAGFRHISNKTSTASSSVNIKARSTNFGSMMLDTLLFIKHINLIRQK